MGLLMFVSSHPPPYTINTSSRVQPSRIPGPIMNVYIWAPIATGTLPNNSGCYYPVLPPTYAFVPFVLQATFDLLVFLMCTGKVCLEFSITM